MCRVRPGVGGPRRRLTAGSSPAAADVGAIMAVNAFVMFFDKADGESIQRGNEKWIEIQGCGSGRSKLN